MNPQKKTTECNGAGGGTPNNMSYTPVDLKILKPGLIVPIDKSLIQQCDDEPMKVSPEPVEEWEKEFETLMAAALFSGIDVHKLAKISITLRAFIKKLLAEKEREIVICAAVISKEGNVFRCHRHGNGFRTIEDSGQTIDASPDAQGFITSLNRFVSRKEGLRIQKAANISSANEEEGYSYELYSEDLY